MKEWLLFGLFLAVGLGMLVEGIFYMRNEKNDPESVKIYKIIAAIGAVLSVAAIIVKFVF